jgi:hypothetical protein
MVGLLLIVILQIKLHGRRLSRHLWKKALWLLGPMT